MAERSPETRLELAEHEIRDLRADIMELKADAREREKREARVVWGFVMLLGGAVATLVTIIWNYVRPKVGL